eukprot:6236774-Alexandrium_andersonii.AAC.1
MLWRRPMTAAMISPGRMSCSKPGNTVETAAAALPFLAMVTAAHPTLRARGQQENRAEASVKMVPCNGC